MRSQRGQSTVEWVALLALVASLLAITLLSVGARPPGAALAGSIASRLICAAQLASCADSADSALVAQYGEEAATLVRRYAPELQYEPGSQAVPVDFRRCRSPICGNGRRSGPIVQTETGEPVTAFTHVVRRGSATYIQYWLYYPDSATLRRMPVVGAEGFHSDDWESVQIRLGPGGHGVDARASSHHGYGGGDGAMGWAADTGFTHPSGWKPNRGKVSVAGGSHANITADPPSLTRRLQRVVGEERQPYRWTPKSRLRLVPIESLARDCGEKLFAITPPWCKKVYGDPEYAGTD
ncbi:MAG: hypothetical protein QOE56_209 [Solirubrobacterales bacterium]|nr:hypothetical protein [Solirubrobacterales bacterium]